MNLVPLPPEREAEAVELYSQVYRTDPVVPQLLRSVPPSEWDRYLRAYFRTVVRNALRYGSTMCVIEEGKLVAIGTYYPPGRYPIPLRVQLRDALEMAPVLGLKRVWFMLKAAGAIDRMHPRESHLYSEIGVVHPEYQGRKIAARMLAHAFEEADLAGVGVFGETSNPSNVPIWEKIGFKMIGEVDAAGVKYWCLWREARK